VTKERTSTFNSNHVCNSISIGTAATLKEKSGNEALMGQSQAIYDENSNSLVEDVVISGLDSYDASGKQGRISSSVKSVIAVRIIKQETTDVNADVFNFPLIATDIFEMSPDSNLEQVMKEDAYSDNTAAPVKKFDVKSYEEKFDKTFGGRASWKTKDENVQETKPVKISVQQRNDTICIDHHDDRTTASPTITRTEQSAMPCTVQFTIPCTMPSTNTTRSVSSNVLRDPHEMQSRYVLHEHPVSADVGFEASAEFFPPYHYDTLQSIQGGGVVTGNMMSPPTASPRAIDYDSLNHEDFCEMLDVIKNFPLPWIEEVLFCKIYNCMSTETRRNKTALCNTLQIICRTSRAVKFVLHLNPTPVRSLVAPTVSQTLISSTMIEYERNTPFGAPHCSLNSEGLGVMLDKLRNLPLHWCEDKLYPVVKRALATHSDVSVVRTLYMVCKTSRVVVDLMRASVTNQD